jgi:4-hydroxy-tetrahydrodipicolinate reductase
MEERPGIAVMGAAGRMGRALIAEVAASAEARLSGALVRPGDPCLGEDAGSLAGLEPLGVPVTDDPLEIVARSRALLDFTEPEASLGFAVLAAQARAVHVIGTTGFDEGQVARLGPVGRHAVVVRAGNTSLGVSLLAGLARRVAEALPDWDVEVLETHHRMKRDAPSGTALMLGEAVARGRGTRLADALAVDRDGARPEGAIGMASLRMGDVVGEHEVAFAGRGERVVLRHVATDRAIFARGALRAALWGLGRKPGLYGMADVLGL